MSSRTALTALLVPALAAGSLLAARDEGQQQQGGVFRAASETVPIYATVTDREGRLVPDLERQHFMVYDNGELQELTIFETDVQPFTAVVMLDTSGSMTMNIDILKIAAERFVIRMLPADRARIGSFSDKIVLSPEFTNDRDELMRILREEIQFGNPTFLWDATFVSMEALAAESGRRVVLVFTDGEDQFSERYDYGDVLERAQSDGVMIYAIGLEGRVGNARTRPDRNLRRLAAATGGGYFELTRAADLNATFTRVIEELHRQYVLGFTPKALDGRLHQLEVRTTVPGMTVRARQSYVAERR